MPTFHGSYLAHQVQFLLKPITLEPISDIQQKEKLIQSGKRHYSEMLSPEVPPSQNYLALFQQACKQNLTQMAKDCLTLASLIAQKQPKPPALVSLARAGTPIGVALQHILSQHYAENVQHYSISIIRDRGIDQNALHYILAQGFSDQQIVFIDGWTGKGVISRELCKFIAEFNRLYNTHISPELYVLTDLAGVSPFSASQEDYLIPSSILNACVSGLVSRSVLNEQISPSDFHGCVYFKEFEPFDLSQEFIRQLTAETDHLQQQGLPQAQPQETKMIAQISQQFIQGIAKKYAIQNFNYIKPGIGEATRVMLRRQPELLLLRNAHADSTQHLRRLAEEKRVEIKIQPDLPYQAVALIKDMSKNA